MLIYPFISFSCTWELYNPTVHLDVGFPQDYCIRHRYERVMRRHAQSLVLRQQNDQWLREIGTDSSTGRLVRNVGRRRMRTRERSGIHRACRCGAEIKFNRNRNARVFMCLGCEGIVHVPGPQDPWPGVGTTPWSDHRLGSLRRTARRDMRLRRAI